MALIKALLARAIALVRFEAIALQFGIPLITWRIRRARIAAFRRQWLCDPGNQEAAALAGVAGGERVFLAELIPAIARFQARRAQQVQASRSTSGRKANVRGASVATASRDAAGCAFTLKTLNQKGKNTCEINKAARL
jgi:hypothetical protein